MRFMIIRKADADTEAAAMPTAKLFEEMGAYNEEMVNAGVMLSGDGLLPSSRGARIRFRNGTPTITDGQFAEAKELIAGFTIIQVASREEALDWVRRWPTADGNGNVELELRQIAEAEDFGEAFTPELREREDRLRDQLAEQR
ncbi:MAG TPA: YciI family protein [Longimicrobium sp.]|nr:YciI family protein [Longimicrobium sp.]